MAYSPETALWVARLDASIREAWARHSPAPVPPVPIHVLAFDERTQTWLVTVVDREDERTPSTVLEFAASTRVISQIQIDADRKPIFINGAVTERNCALQQIGNVVIYYIYARRDSDYLKVGGGMQRVSCSSKPVGRRKFVVDNILPLLDPPARI